MDQGDLIAQFCAVTDSEVETATQYLDAANYDLESAIGLFYASDGASAQGQTDAFEVRDRIEGTTDQLVDPEELEMEEMMRHVRRVNRQQRQTRSVFNQGRNEEDLENLTPHERRLARLFRPPFDLIEDIGLDDAKEQAQQLDRWILINVQDSAEFQCQLLNRDLWSNQQIKEIIGQSFVFLQYDIDSEDGEMYRAFYPFNDFPHIAIIDPWTGEQQKTWSSVPKPEHFLEQLMEYIGDYAGGGPKDASGAASDVTSTVASGVVSGLTTPAQSASAVASATTSNAVSATASAAPSIGGTPATTAASVGASAGTTGPSVAFTAIEPHNVPEPTENATRIQLRTGDGRRVVHKFALDARVLDIYAFVKFSMPDLDTFTLTADRKNLESQLDNTIEGANLKNSLVLIDST